MTQKSAEAATAKEKSRIKEIRAIAEKLDFDDDWTTKQIDGTNTIEEVHALAVEKMAEQKQPAKVQVGDDLNRSSIGQALLDAFLIKAGHKVEKPADRAANFTGRSLVECAREHMRAWGANHETLSNPQVARAVFTDRYMPPGIVAAGGGAGVYGHTTSDFPLILQDAANKFLSNGFIETTRTWQQWMRKRTVADFKNINAYKFGEVPDLTVVPEGAEYEYVTIGEEREVYALAKFGKLFDITWEAIINDDMDAFTRIPQMMGAAAARLEESIAYTPLTFATNGQVMADGTDLFHADHSNLPTAAALTVTNLGIARALMRVQTGISSAIINVEPKFLIVPPELETVAKQLIASTVDPAMANATPNPFHNELQVIVVALLSADDSNAWYLAASSNQIDTIEMAFLQGEETPFLAQQDGFAVEGRRYKVRHTVASHAIDHRGMLKNIGA